MHRNHPARGDSTGQGGRRGTVEGIGPANRYEKGVGVLQPGDIVCAEGADVAGVDDPMCAIADAHHPHPPHATATVCIVGNAAKIEAVGSVATRPVEDGVRTQSGSPGAVVFVSVRHDDRVEWTNDLGQGEPAAEDAWGVWVQAEARVSVAVVPECERGVAKPAQVHVDAESTKCMVPM